MPWRTSRSLVRSSNTQRNLRLCFPPIAVQNQLGFNIEKAKNLASLHSLVGKGVLNMGIAEKVAGSGLNQ